MNKVLTFVKQFVVPVVGLVLPVMAFAQGLSGVGSVAQPGGSGGGIQGPNGVTAPSNILNSTSAVTGSVCGIVNWLFYGLIILTVIMVLLAAYGYLTSGGDPDKTKAASQKLLFAAIAIIVALIAKGFPDLISNFIGGNNYSSSAFGC